MAYSLKPERDPSLFVAQPVKPGEEVVLDELPDDAPESELQYELLTQFLAYVRSSRITVGGEVEITLGIPFEFKYDALPLTDLRGLNFSVTIHQPVVASGPARSETVDQEASGFDPLSALRGA